MARLVFLAVLLAAATYASADDTTTAAAKHLQISTCTKGAADMCEGCKNETAADFTADGKCKADGTSSYKATCETDGKWTLELFSDDKCTDGSAVDSISTAGKCFDGKTIIIAKVTSVVEERSVSVGSAGEESKTEYSVDVNVCPPAAAAKACADVENSACPNQPLKVKEGTTGTECEKLPNKVDNKEYYYSAVVEKKAETGGRAMRKQDVVQAKAKLSLWLYTTKETCKAKLPMFVGNDMEVKEEGATTDNSCKDYQQKLNAELCGVPPTTTTTNNENTTLAGSAAVSAVLALLAAACAVWMM